jgi:hypothetical protein
MHDLFFDALATVPKNSYPEGNKFLMVFYTLTLVGCMSVQTACI